MTNPKTHGHDCLSPHGAVEEVLRLHDDRWGWLWSNWWNEDWQGKPKYSEKICPSATLPTTNPTWPDTGLNPGSHGGKPATNHLSYGAAPILSLSPSLKRCPVSSPTTHHSWFLFNFNSSFVLLAEGPHMSPFACLSPVKDPQSLIACLATPIELPQAGSGPTEVQLQS
jgi:hypothetical protein